MSGREGRAAPTAPSSPAREAPTEKSLVESRFEATHGQPIASPPLPVYEPALRPAWPGRDRRKRKASDGDVPPTPPGCEWLKTDNGWNLWRYWTERDPVTGDKIRKTRYAGVLTKEAWEVMKDYDYET